MAPGRSATEQLVVELVGRTDRLEADIARMRKQVGDVSSAGTKGTAAVAAGASDMGDRFGRSARQIASATENMARLGRVGGESMKQIVSQGGEMAFMFGPGGAIVGALGIATIAVVELFQRSRREMEETRRKFREELGQMVESGDVMGLGRRQQRLYSGAGKYAQRDPDKETAIEFEVRKAGVEGTARRIAQLEADIALLRGQAYETTTNLFGKTVVRQRPGEDAATARDEIKRAREEVDALNNALEKLLEQSAETQDALADAMKRTSEEAKNNLSAMQDEASAAQAKLNYEIERTTEATKEAKREARELAKVQANELRASIETALATASGSLAEAASLAIEERAKKLQKEILFNEALTVAEKIRLSQTVELTRQLERAQATAKETIAKSQATLTSVMAPGGSPSHDLAALADRQKELTAEREKALRLGISTREIDETLLEIDRKRVEILKALGLIVKDNTDTAKKERAELEQMARAIGDAVNGALELANAFGLIDDKSTRVLQNIGQIASRMPLAMAGDAGGIASIIGNVAGLGNALFGGNTEAERAHAKVVEDNSEALRRLTAKIGDLKGPASTLDPALRAVSLVTGRFSEEEIRYAQIRGLSTKADVSGLTPADWDAINDAAKALGITLDGTGQSFYDLMLAISRARPELEAQFQQQQKELREDLEVRRLRAEGLDEEADALAFALEQERERTKAVEDLASAETMAALAATQAAEAQRRAAEIAHQALVEALQRALTDADQLAAINDITDPTGIFAGKARAYRGAGGVLGALFEGFDLDNLSDGDIAKLDAAFRELFKQLKESPEAVDLAGLSVEELIAALLDLDSAADEAAAAAQAVASSFDAIGAAGTKLSLDEAILGTTPTAHAENVARKYGSSLSRFDLTTKAGVDAAIAYWQGVYKSAPQLGPQILEIIQALQAIPFDTLGAGPGTIAGRAPNLSSDYTATAEVRSITIEQGGRMLDTMTAILVTLTDIKALLIAAASTIITPPQLPFAFAGSGGATSVTINIYQAFYGPVGQVDRLAAASFAEAVYDELNRRFGVDVKNAGQLRGNVMQR